jgi:hypothetical protein
MPTPVKPDSYARRAGFNHIDFVEAVKNGESEYAGVPIGDWRQEGGEFLLIPDDHADRLGFGGNGVRSNPSGFTGQQQGVDGGGGSTLPQSTGAATAQAIGKAAPPVSANAGAAYAASQFAETVKEQPQVMEDFADTAALLGSAGLAYATAEEGDVLKAGATAAGMFAAWKLLRHMSTQQDRRTDMQERQQRARIQDNRRRQNQVQGVGGRRQLNAINSQI